MRLKCLLYMFFKIVSQALNSSHYIAFRPGHLTTLKLVNRMDDIYIYTNNNESIVAIFLGVEKAIDRTWYDGLIFKLAIMKIPTTITKLIESRVLFKQQLFHC